MNDDLTVTRKDGSLRFEVHAKPRARKSAVVGVSEGKLEVALGAPPVDGAANDALVELLSDVLGVPKRAVSIVRGGSSRHKLVSVEGVDEARLRALLVGG